MRFLLSFILQHVGELHRRDRVARVARTLVVIGDGRLVIDVDAAQFVDGAVVQIDPYVDFIV